MYKYDPSTFHRETKLGTRKANFTLSLLSSSIKLKPKTKDRLAVRSNY